MLEIVTPARLSPNQQHWLDGVDVALAGIDGVEVVTQMHAVTCSHWLRFMLLEIDPVAVAVAHETFAETLENLDPDDSPPHACEQVADLMSAGVHDIDSRLASGLITRSYELTFR